MKNYINALKKKYRDIIREMSAKGSDSLGEIVKEIVKKAKSKGIETNKAEVRDAIMVFAAGGILDIKKYKQKRLEVIFKKERE